MNVALDEQEEEIKRQMEEERNTPANNRQVGGSHYQSQIQHWDWVAANNLDYFQGQITKCVARWKNKGGVEDLKKARHFLDKYIELAEREKKGITDSNFTDVVHYLDERCQTPCGNMLQSRSTTNMLHMITCQECIKAMKENDRQYYQKMREQS